MLLDGAAEINVINQGFVVASDLRPIESELPAPQFMDGKEVYCYGAYEVVMALEDTWERQRTFTSVFYAIDKQGPDLVLGLPGLKQLGIVIDYGAKRWRYGFQSDMFELCKPKQFAKTLDSGAPLYAIVAQPIAPSSERQPVNVGAVDENNSRNTNETQGIPVEFAEFQDVFSKDRANQLATHKDCDHAIDLEGGDPPYGPLYNLSNTELKTLREYLDDALAKGWIRHSTSSAGAPILFVPKKDGTLRLCVDYRGLNKVTKKNRHPLPLITQILDQLNGCSYFTKMDLRDAYHRLRIRKGDEWKTAFRSRYGHYEYMVMPFGLANAPATFQAYINKALSGIVDVFCVVYLDDILVFSKDRTSHVEHVKEVLRRLRKHDLYANLKKCEFFAPAVEYLGFIISSDGISMDPRRVETVRDWPALQSFRDIQVFLGFANFYRRFIRHYSQITRPLTDMLKGMQAGIKRGTFYLTAEGAEAFSKLKEAFQGAPILVHFDPELLIRLETDASDFGISGIISQLQKDGQWHPVAFYSRKMIPAERNYETHDQELLAIVMCFKHWRHYLEGSLHPVEVLTDHNNLRGFMNIKVLSGRQARWAMKLAAYDFVIMHRSGKTNPADAPSRRPDYQSINTEVTRLLPTLQKKLSKIDSLCVGYTPGIRTVLAALRYDLRSKIASSGIEPLENLEGETSKSITSLDEESDTFEVGLTQCIPRAVAVALSDEEKPLESASKSVLELIKALQGKDAFVSSRRETVAKSLKRKGGRSPEAIWTIDSNDLLNHRGRIYVPDEESIRAELLRRHHDDKLAGHFGAEKTAELLTRKYYWKGLNKTVKKYTESCDICQRTKAPRHRPYGVMQSLPRPSGPWKEITMDFITGFPPSKRFGRVYDSCLVIVDRYTKMALYIPVTKKINAVDLAEILFESVVLQFGAPEGIVSDRGSVFTSEYWSEICFHLKTKRRLSTAFHPQTDGQTERQNQTLEHYLRVYCTDNQSNWVALLPLAQFVYQVSYQSTLGCSPFYCMYGYNPEIRYEVGDDIAVERVPAAKERVKQLHEFRYSLEARWKSVSEAQAKYYNRKHLEKDFNEGDLVMLSAKNLKQKRPSKKLSHKFLGPFRILEAVGKQAYRLALPTTYRIHPVFHVSYLEPYKRRDGQEHIPFLPPPEIINDEQEWEVEEIIGRRSEKGEIFYKVKWVGYPEEYDEWVPEKDLDGALELKQDFDAKPKAKRRRIKKLQVTR